MQKLWATPSSHAPAWELGIFLRSYYRVYKELILCLILIRESLDLGDYSIMALMPGLQINMGQQLKLTPQLQQSIKILQYSALEVQQTITTTLETNFMLEVGEEIEEELYVDSKPTEDTGSEATETIGKSEIEIDMQKLDVISAELDIDCQWEEVYTDVSPPASSQSLDDYVAAENYTSSEQSLHDKLYWQSDIYPWTGSQELISSYLIDDINDEGYLKSEIEYILEVILNNENKIKILLADIEEVLCIIQKFEPTGVGARNIQECLLLQLQAEKQTPFVVTARQIIAENFEWLSQHDFKRIKKLYGLNEADLKKVILTIQSQNPRPGRIYASIQNEIIIPDLKLSRAKQGYIVELNSKAFPRLSVNSAYIKMTKGLNNTKQSKKIKEQIIEAKGLIKSIHSRGETLLKVGRYIIERQTKFFEKGEHFMQPMVLRDVAEYLDLHESTISRATNQKYMQTPRGTFELKYFFSTGVAQYGSEDQSAISIKAYIKELIATESTQKPLSDNKIMALLENKNINVARRTIAKYREALGIPSSSERKKLNKFK